jgi:outer membrane protein assembly factor BamB
MSFIISPPSPNDALTRICATKCGCDTSSHHESKTAVRLCIHLLRQSIAATFLAVLAISQSFAADWPMHRGNPSLNGRSEDAAPAHAVLRWTFKAGSPVKGSAAIAGGRVFFGDDGGIVHALNLADGKEAWTFKTEGPIEATPLILDGLCYIGSSDGKLYALDAATGAKKWAHETNDKVLAGASWVKDPASDAKWVLVGSYDFSLYALDATSGKVLWKVETENFINGTPALTGDGHAVFGGCDAQLHVISLRERKEVRKIDAESYIASSVAADGTMVYLGNESKKVFAFDTATGATKWTYRDRSFSYYSSPALSADAVIIGGRDKRLHCIDRVKGEARWVFATRGDVDSSPVLCKDGGILVGSRDGRLYCVELADGKQRWSYEIGAPITASPAIANGAIVIGAEDGTVHCIGGK